MPGVNIASLGDLLTGTLKKTPKGKITETLKRSRYAGVQAFWANNKENLSGGTYYEARVRARAGGTAKFVNPYQSTPNDVRDLMVTMQTPAAYYEAKMRYDERELLHNANGEQIVSIIDTRRSGCYEDIYNLVEDNLPLAPTSATPAAGDPQELYGLSYWFPMLGSGVTDTVGGFNGITVNFRDGTTSTTVANVDRNLADNSRLRSWVATYGGTITADTLRTIRNAMVNTDFVSLPKIDGQSLKGDGEHLLFMSHERANEYEDLVNAGPDDRNNDTMPFHDVNRFRGTKVVRMPSLSGITYTPFYGAYTKHTYGVTWKGDHMRETDAVNSPTELRTWTVGVVGTTNLTCDNPRAGGFCIHTPRS